MIKQLKKRVAQTFKDFNRRNQQRRDLLIRAIGDPLALKISWTLTKEENLPSKQSRLKITKNGNIHYLTNWEKKTLAILVFTFGVMLCFAPFIPSIERLIDEPLRELGFGFRRALRHWEANYAVSILFGAGCMYFSARGLKSPNLKQSFSYDQQCYNYYGQSVPFSDIHAIQYLIEFDNVRTLYHEINVVLKTGQRFPIIRSRRRLSWRRKARQLARALNVPLWKID